MLTNKIIKIEIRFYDSYDTREYKCQTQLQPPPPQPPPPQPPPAVNTGLTISTRGIDTRVIRSQVFNPSTIITQRAKNTPNYTKATLWFFATMLRTSLDGIGAVVGQHRIAPILTDTSMSALVRNTLYTAKRRFSR